jgi:hypothetical protein
MSFQDDLQNPKLYKRTGPSTYLKVSHNADGTTTATVTNRETPVQPALGLPEMGFADIPVTQASTGSPNTTEPLGLPKWEF